MRILALARMVNSHHSYMFITGGQIITVIDLISMMQINLYWLLSTQSFVPITNMMDLFHFACHIWSLVDWHLPSRFRSPRRNPQIQWFIRFPYRHMKKIMSLNRCPCFFRTHFGWCFPKNWPRAIPQELATSKLELGQRARTTKWPGPEEQRTKRAKSPAIVVFRNVQKMIQKILLFIAGKTTVLVPPCGISTETTEVNSAIPTDVQNRVVMTWCFEHAYTTPPQVETVLV